MNWVSLEEETVFSGPHLGEDWRKKTRAQEGVRAPEPHRPMRADGPNSVWMARWPHLPGLVKAAFLEDWPGKVDWHP